MNKLAQPLKYNKLILAVSIVIPVVVALLFGIKIDYKLPVFLPPIYASINALTALILIASLVVIKKGNVNIHEKLNKTAIVLSLLFLVMYVLHHMTSESVSFPKEGPIRYLYLFILFSHIILSVTVIPLVLISYVRAISGQIELHKKVVKYAYPIWLYVAITGVVVYFMISPYYA